MATWSNDAQGYGRVAVWLHWATALVLVFLVALGLYMVSLPDSGQDQQKITLILLHKSVGLFALAMVLVRMAWRSVNALPGLPAALPGWQKLAARVMHLALYALMLLLPITGWLMSSAGGFPVPVFAGFNLPDLVGPDPRLFRELIALHRWLADALVVLVALHAAAALDHHLRRRDGTLSRMLP